MGKKITEQNSDGLLNTDLVTFVANADKYKAILKIDAAALTALTKAAGDFSTALAKANTAKAAQKAATATKDADKKKIKALVAQYAKTWRADLSIPDAILDEMMVPNHQTQGSKTPPTQPLKLSLKVNSVGLITLNWDKNGNTSGTIYNVETAETASGDWSTYDVTTKTKINYSGTPGTGVWFRVSAKRNGQTSSYSLPISIWATGGGPVELQIAA